MGRGALQQEVARSLVRYPVTALFGPRQRGKSTLARLLGEQRGAAIFHMQDGAALSLHPSSGASWEGFVLEQIFGHLRPDESCFWQTQAGVEFDLPAISGGKRIGFEMKLAESPRTTKSMHIAMEDLRLDHLLVVHPGNLRFALTEGVTALRAREIPLLAKP